MRFSSFSAIVCFVTTLPAAANYTVTEIPTLGGPTSQAYGINNHGLVVGSADTETPDIHHAFLFMDGQIIDLGTFGDHRSIATDVNHNDQILGFSIDDTFFTQQNTGFLTEARGGRGFTPLFPLAGDPPDNSAIPRAVNESGLSVGTSIEFDTLRAVAWATSAASDLGTIDGPQADAWGINDRGDIVGWTNNFGAGGSLFNRRAFAILDGPMADLGSLGGTWSWAFDVNESRQIVGESSGPEPIFEAFFWEDGDMIGLGNLTGEPVYSRAIAINESAQVVGWSFLEVGDTTRHAFIWEDGVMSDLNDLLLTDDDWVLAEAHDINDAGAIVGIGFHDGEERGFLLTPLDGATGDLDDDGDVDFGDLLHLLGAWGPCDSACPADFDASGTVGFADILILLANWS